MEGVGKPDQPEWRSGHVFKMPTWVEPVFIVTMLFTSMYITRRKNFSLFGKWRPALPGRTASSYFYERIAGSAGSSPAPGSPRLSTDSDDGAAMLTASDVTTMSSIRPLHPPKTRRVFGIWTVRTPNSSRFAGHFHSRILQKFPFLIEMFYWVVTLLFYKSTGIISQYWFGGFQGLWDIAVDHGVAILELEAVATGYGGATGTQRWLEWRLQQWFLEGGDVGDWRGWWLTCLNRSYALIHIPGTVGFLAFYYWAAPTFTRFASMRRTMSLVSMFAFTVFMMYPTAPPRFLPKEYGFVDTVNAEDAQSVWQSGDFVNKLAAMPSMHFGYAFTVGMTLVVESGVLDGLRRRASAALYGYDMDDLEASGVKSDSVMEGIEESGFYDADAAALAAANDTVAYRRSTAMRVWLFFFGVFYPAWILLAIMATANHYLLDAIVASFAVGGAWMCNRFLLNFLPLEDWLLWALRLEKPIPTTGWPGRRMRR